MIDTHAHLDACADAPERLLERALEAGVERVIAIGSGLESCRTALALAERHRGVFAALGIHPHQAGGEESGRLDELRDLLSSERAVAIGETGLDFYRDYAPHDAQRRLLEGQLELAGELGKPVVIHCRAAETETARALEGLGVPVVLHCFSAPALLPVARERGYYVSFAGNVTYGSADELRAAAAAVEPDRILVETDCPYLSPAPRRGRPNEPANVVHTLRAVAAARGELAEELAARIDANAAAVFALP